MNESHRSSPCLPPDRIRDLVVELEQSGVDSHRIDVVAEPARTQSETSRVDRETMSRPIGRAALGAVLGLVVGGIVAGVLAAVVDDLPGAVFLVLALAGAILGGLSGLYIRLTVSTDVVDVDTGQDSFVQVDVSGLDGDDVGNVEQILNQAS